MYKILKCLFETDSFDKLYTLGLSEDELMSSLNEIKDSVEKDESP